jgi:hypothetical protein
LTRSGGWIIAGTLCLVVWSVSGVSNLLGHTALAQAKAEGSEMKTRAAFAAKRIDASALHVQTFASVQAVEGAMSSFTPTAEVFAAEALFDVEDE